MTNKIAKDGNGSVPRHPDDADLISYLDGELAAADQDHTRTHLEGCWNCRSRMLAVQGSIENFLRARKQTMPSEVPPPGAAVAQFRRRLAQHQNASVALRAQLPRWFRNLNTAFSGLLRPILVYKKTAIASLLVVLSLAVLLLDPLKWNSVSAGELLTRASAYEFLNETPSGKVVRARARFDRINLTTKAQENLGQIETDADGASKALYISVDSAGVARKRALPDRDQPADLDSLVTGFGPDTARYLAAQGWMPQVSVSLYQRLIAGRGLAGNDGATAKRNGTVYEIHHGFAVGHPSHITETVLTLNVATYAPQTVSIFTVEDSEHLEYRLTRTSIESIERTPEIAKLFEPPANENAKKTTVSPATPNTLSRPPDESLAMPLTASPAIASAD